MNKRKTILIIVVFLMVCAVGIVLASVSGSGRMPIFSADKSTGFKKAIFERNGEICQFDYSEGTITILAGDGKYSPALSPDKSKVLYRNSVLETEGNAMRFGIMTIDGKPIREIVIDSELSNDIIECQWLSDSAVGITTYVNPSTSEFFIYNAETGEKMKSYAGYSFAHIPNTEKVVHAKNVPYWSDEPVYHSFVIDGETVYTSDVLDARLGPPVFSDDGAKFAFVENLPKSNDSETLQRIITGDFNKTGLTFTNIRRINVPSEVSGYLAFDESNHLCIVDSNSLHIYNEKTSEFITSKSSADLRNRSGAPKDYAALQTAVTEYWGDDSLDKINSITWIPE